MEISNNYSTAKVWNTSDKNVSKPSEKNKWKLTDSLKEKIVDLAKKDAQNNVYMGMSNVWQCSGNKKSNESL